MDIGKFIDRFNPKIKKSIRIISPLRLRNYIRKCLIKIDNKRDIYHLEDIQQKVLLGKFKTGENIKLFDYSICINDGTVFLSIYRDVFIKRIYHFVAQCKNPLILDCGSNIGGTILYFKHIYPQARIIGFEPDPLIFSYLEENIKRNGIKGVELIRAALNGKEGIFEFYSDGKQGSRLEHHLRTNLEGWEKHEVRCVRLKNYLTEPVDFMKMNIEGAEWEVLSDCKDRLQLIREMIIEYHHLPGLPRTLHHILGLLDRQGFEYQIYSFDSKPVFCLVPETSYYLLVYAKRIDSVNAVRENSR